MAKLGFHLLCILFTFAFSTVHPRTISPATTVSTSELDVTDSIQKSLNVLSFSPQPQQSQMLTSSELSSSSSSSSILSLQLHSRVAVHKSSHKSYKSVTLARLARDSARVESLQTRLDLAVNGVKKSDLKPVDTELSVENLEVPVVSGTSQGSGEYFCRVGIGHPASQAYMVLDTGSDVNWLQCAPCADCYQQADPIFEPASSSSYSPLTCDAHQCKSLDVSECRNGTCLYEVSYGDGSYTVGDFVTETLTLQGSTTVENIAIGCGHNNEGLFVGAAGLIGLGGGRLSFPSQINATSYSYCLVDRDSDSASTLEFNSPIPHDAITAPLLRNSKLDTFYYIGLTGISVAGQLLNIPSSTFKLTNDGNSGVIVDSGTAITRLQTEAYNVLRDAFTKGTKELPAATGVALFDTCYDLSKRKSVQVPTVSFHFTNGKKLDLPAKNYLIPVDSSGTFCFAFAPTSSSLSIIGNVQQQGTRVSYDLENSVIGFSPNKC
ncbi:putative nepenthesin [Helianthus annuus]|uniref:Nepenthesin n=1 Tax=Helianthus annuus TaxID=4232 RepID=A0A251S349_HELAN|nr:protein ASPARTIC PROTEASE IN GUARD CELL 1 [Helianthus annuus]KAF5762252.1 putative nepenthesin [Helianthus annuus]KAJ0445264.1 putative nepenthesin [Helianthus annuus]KAJ0646651.1 putative nepenthesin [Helianthus annuus]KAJ0823376.1 putative nepenthesin [Helianthus annuus]KAJ0838095.1 putative nepenthesin [Helianthus annuus]